MIMISPRWTRRLFLLLSVSNVLRPTTTVARAFSLNGGSGGGGGGHHAGSRRSFVDDLMTAARGGAAATAVATFGRPAPSLAIDGGGGDEEEEEIEVFFGCGCFWHVQHEFATAEKRILGRSEPSQLTARAGYAGGKGGMLNGKVCYHNAKKVSDYGALGHAEVVGLKIPPSSFPAFAEEYAKLFDEYGKRADQDGDRGLEYRNVVGFPGGAAESSKYLAQLVDASKANGDKLAFARGVGDDPDRRALVFVMDTAEFPFYVAERYHQFHDGFKMGENYPPAYNRMAEELAKTKSLGVSQCPNGMI